MHATSSASILQLLFNNGVVLAKLIVKINNENVSHMVLNNEFKEVYNVVRWNTCRLV
jgi:hypothetical protein